MGLCMTVRGEDLTSVENVGEKHKKGAKGGGGGRAHALDLAALFPPLSRVHLSTPDD